MTAGRLRTTLLGVVLATFLVVLPAQALAVSITEGPAEGSTVNTNSVHFRYATDQPSLFWCSLDADKGGFCSPSESFETSGSYGFGNLSDGTHTFYVSATSFDGSSGTVVQTGYSSAQRTFTVDTRPPVDPDATPPDTTITQAPAKRVKARKSANVKVEFSSTEPGSTFTCRVDDGAARACSAPAGFKLGKGKHKISIAATDAAGNTDSSPATVQVEVKKKHKSKRA